MLWPRAQFFARQLQRLLGLGAAVLLATQVAAHPAEALSNYQHTAFQHRDGAPGDIASIAQTSDGYLWLAGTKGLTRFDGTEFRPFHPVSGEHFLEAQLDNIFPAEGGGLWISNQTAGPTLLKDGHLTHFDSRRGYVGSEGVFLADPHGVVWAMSSNALLRFVGGSWHVIEATKLHHRLMSGAFDASGNLWAVAHSELVVRPVGANAFVQVPNGPDDSARLFFGPSGHLYVLTTNGVQIYRTDGTSITQIVQTIPIAAYAGMEDSNGSLWLASHKAVQFASADNLRAAASAGDVAPAMESISRAEGLSGNIPWPIVQDREGDIWVGTQAGLDRFRSTTFKAVDLPDGIHEVSASIDAQGTIWVGSETHNVLRITPPVMIENTHVPIMTLATYYDAFTHIAWAANAQGLWQMSPGSPKLVAPFTSPGLPGSVRCVIADRGGVVYVCDDNDQRGILSWNRNAWHEVLDKPFPAMTLAVDQEDNLWVGGDVANTLLKVVAGKVRVFGPPENLSVGAVKAIFVDKNMLWVGGDNGVQFFDGTRFTSLLTKDPDVLKPATGLVLDARGNLWIQTLDGVLLVSANEVRKALSQQSVQISYRLFDRSYGVQGAPDPDRALPTLRIGGDGMIWAQTSSGLSWMDPNVTPSEPAPPTVHIDSVSTGDNSHLLFPADNLLIPSSQRTVHIAYSTPELFRPERLHFWYRLIGFNSNWQDAGSQREVTYTNLSPRSYRFEIKAVNAEGVSSMSPTVMTLTRSPTFYETWWFRALIVVPIAMLLWLFHWMRMHNLQKQADIRADEREAISRDIHDTLLQRIQGVMLALQIWSSDESIAKGRREEISSIYNQAREAMAEGRERLLSLRRKEDQGLGLYDELMAEGRQLASNHDMAFFINLEGSPQEINEACRSELRDIGFEAMRNAFAHSMGTEIRLVISYAADALFLNISDNGKGLDQADALQACAQGHVGLSCMRERVETLKGALNIKAGPNEGTEIDVRIPARYAYLQMKRSWSLMRIFQKFHANIVA
jgi:signal transduction histidine kinase/ligand-binding sensor domain-containing protein